MWISVLGDGPRRAIGRATRRAGLASSELLADGSLVGLAAARVFCVPSGLDAPGTLPTAVERSDLRGRIDDTVYRGVASQPCGFRRIPQPGR